MKTPKNTKPSKVVTKEEKPEVPTTLAELMVLKQKRNTAVAEYNKYLKKYNKENNIQGRLIIKEIIDLYKKGLDNKAIIAKGYNKWTVNEQIRLFKKGKRVTKTVIAKFLPPKEKK